MGAKKREESGLPEGRGCLKSSEWKEDQGRRGKMQEIKAQKL